MFRTPVVMLFFLFLLVAFLLADSGHASTDREEGDRFGARLVSLIGRAYGGTRVELRRVHLPENVEPDARQVEWISDDGKGTATFTMLGQSFSAEFSAFKKTFVAKRRVRPGERLESSFFELREVDVSRGIAREYRGMMLNESSRLDSLEAQQTILEGHFPLASGVREAPDVRRGETLKMRLTSGGLVLSTQATASEPGHKGKQLRVMTLTSKRQLTGTLLEDGSVEVSL